MITRRSFLSALACLPFVGKFLGGVSPTGGDAVSCSVPAPIESSRMGVRFKHDWRLIESSSQKFPSGCTFHEKDGVRTETHTDRCDCRNRSYFVKAEWDLKYQA